MKTNSNISRSLGIKLTLSLALVALTVASFATLVIEKNKPVKPRQKLLSNPSSLKPGTFSLRSGYTFRGNQVITDKTESYLNLNTVVVFQQGRTTYLMPVKKKVSVNLGSQNQVKGATVNIRF